MRLLMPCMKCFSEYGQPDHVLYSADVLNTRVARFTCRREHKSVTALQSHKFELLGELAVNAILDGYTREAVSSSTSALERFQEFYIKVVARSKNTNDVEFKKLWKRVAKQSERQAGAYFFTHLFEEGKAPPLLDESGAVAFRNRVIHEGLIPSRPEAEEYIQAVLDVINPVLVRCVEAHKNIVEQIQFENVRDGYLQAEAGETVSTLSWPTVISASRNVSEPCPNVGDWIVVIQKLRDSMKL
jgi:hypothetical protein